MDNARFHSNGKLLLTGEYVVLDNAEAIALPCKFGQSLEVTSNNSDKFTWKSYLSDGQIWENLSFSLSEIINQNYLSDFEKRLFQILKVIYDEKPLLFKDSYDFTTQLEFHKDWGLGTSSTLVNNLSKWAKIDPYKLLSNTFGGSGYDIAAANCHSPFIYKRTSQRIETKNIIISEKLKKHIYFVYLNKKQNSREGIQSYKRNAPSDKKSLVKEITAITHQILKTYNLEDFESLMLTHENLISAATKQKPIQKVFFKDYKKGIIKSLGAWGGDFIMVTSEQDIDMQYFKDKGFSTIFKYENLVF